MTTTLTPTDVATVPAMLDGFVAMHAAMRRDAARLPRAIAGADRANAVALLGWYRRFHHTIESHHCREDDVIWPELAARSAAFDGSRPALLEDHDVLDVALAESLRTMEALAADLCDATRRGAQQAAEHLDEVLVDHLAREEAAAFGEIARCFTTEEWSAIEEQMMRQTPFRALAFEAPWSLLAMPDAVREARLAEAPVGLRMLYRLSFLPRYQRLVQRAGL